MGHRSFLRLAISVNSLSQLDHSANTVSGGAFIRIFPVFVTKNLVLVGESQYNCQIVPLGTLQLA